jgi:flagellar basal-body rod protein FlgF/flagellar basal-body rod protein FlgG
MRFPAKPYQDLSAPGAPLAGEGVKFRAYNELFFRPANGGLANTLQCSPRETSNVDSGYYAAFTGLLAGTQALELAANNLANVSTTGYKVQREFYKSLTASLGNSNPQQLSSLNRAINNYGVLGGATVDLQAGTLERTGNDLDLAMEGSGFFVVQTKAGLRYTRNGNFRVDADGQLVTAWGDPVMSDQSLPIEIPTGPVSVSADGTISSQGAVVGTLQIVDFAPGTVLVPEGNSTYKPATGSSPTPAADPRVREGMLEASNMSPIAGTIGLVMIQRQNQLLEQALSIFHNDFNKSAAEDLPRVS